MTMESSAEVFTNLSEELNSKAVNSLKNLKAACDLIVVTKGIMNYSRVADVATHNYGGPKKQSVLNSHHLKRYISARIREYTQEHKQHELPQKNINGQLVKEYPSNDLAPRVKQYIDLLLSRLNLAENRYQTLRKWQEDFTKANPITLASCISKGATETGALTIDHQVNDTEQLFQAKKGIHALLDLTTYIENLRVESRGEINKLILDRPGGITHVVLDPKQFDAIEVLLTDLKALNNK